MRPCKRDAKRTSVRSTEIEYVGFSGLLEIETLLTSTHLFGWMNSLRSYIANIYHI
jgi:hypothetical protein